jgi:hypothetical protein
MTYLRLIKKQVSDMSKADISIFNDCHWAYLKAGRPVGIPF